MTCGTHPCALPSPPPRCNSCMLDNAAHRVQLVLYLLLPGHLCQALLRYSQQHHVKSIKAAVLVMTGKASRERHTVLVQGPPAASPTAIAPRLRASHSLELPHVALTSPRSASCHQPCSNDRRNAACNCGREQRQGRPCTQGCKLTFGHASGSNSSCVAHWKTSRLRS